MVLVDVLFGDNLVDPIRPNSHSGGVAAEVARLTNLREISVIVAIFHMTSQSNAPVNRERALHSGLFRGFVIVSITSLNFGGGGEN